MFIAPVLAILSMVSPMILKPDIKDGEVITRLRTIKVIVQSDSVVTQVELYVNGDLHDTATSTPYTFQIDPLAEKDGPEKIMFTGYNTDGQKASVSMTVTINSGAANGPAANTTQARDLLTESKFDDAIYYARLALKSDPNYVSAEIVLARAFFAKGVFDKAEEFAEDALKNDPNNLDALSAVSAIQLKRAFDSYATSGDRNDGVNAIGEAVTKAIQARQKVLDLTFDKVPAPTPATAVSYADTSIRMQHYSNAISALLPAFNASPKTDSGNRIAYAQLRLGRMTELARTLAMMKTANVLDAYSYALLSVLDEYNGDAADADENIKEAIEDGGTNLGVQTAQVYLALHRGKLSTMGPLEATLDSDQGQRPEVGYYLSILCDRLKRYEDSDKAFEETIVTEPIMYPMYIERGNESLKKVVLLNEKGADKSYDSLLAQKMYAAAQIAKPDSAEALTALAILDSTQSKTADALQMANAAVAAAPSYAAAHYEASVAYGALRQNLEAKADQVRKDANGTIDAETQSKIDAINKDAFNASEKAKSRVERSQAPGSSKARRE